MTAGALDESRLRELIDVGRNLVAELDSEVIFDRLLEVACEMTGAAPPRWACSTATGTIWSASSPGIDEATRDRQPARGRVLGL